MFGFLKKELKLVAAIDGTTIDLANVPDPVFAQKMAGDGIAIDPTGDIIVAPCDGELSLIFKTNHAFAMTLDGGIELLVHIGIDTVGLDGKGFERLIEAGAQVKAGTPIIKIDRALIEAAGLSLITPILITNPDTVKSITPIIGQTVKAGIDAVVNYKM
ncbi:PTS glucose transporter subunit IIA [uncultured Clostridium sp.]|jgi:PTS system D-glucosamine-specific IIA component/PTS system glucose-specific IIA component|uniref:PTS sugar transporter subunit IIA n=1 Tax=uncultured Clostridium sp. TaxID=59620 RepID=UPI002613D5B0|nr:PTS glucose transporter subunit IIA [uncultured Clostridium sp.]